MKFLSVLRNDSSKNKILHFVLLKMIDDIQHLFMSSLSICMLRNVSLYLFLVNEGGVLLSQLPGPK